LSCLDRFLLTFLLNVSEDVVENEVSGWLFSQDESLTKLLELSRFVGCFTDNLDDDAILGSLRIDIRNADFAVLEIKVTDALLNSLV